MGFFFNAFQVDALTDLKCPVSDISPSPNSSVLEAEQSSMNKQSYQSFQEP